MTEPFNSRLVRLEGEEVPFTWKDHADHGRIREMTVSREEFLRRLSLHVLPDPFLPILGLCREVLPGSPA